MLRITKLAVLAAALSMALAACGDDAAVTSPATAPPTTAAPSTTAESPPSTGATPASTVAPDVGPRDLPTGVIAPFDTPYSFSDEPGSGDDASPDEIPFPFDGVEAHWYRTGEVLTVVFVGLDLEATGPLCPGTSLLGPAGALYTTNAPTPGGSCEGSAAFILQPPAGVKICDGLVSYVTPIPADEPGLLFAVIELYTGTGINYGVSGFVPTDPDYMAEIDPASLEC